MDKNINICYCILGSIILALVNSNIFEYSRFGLFYAGTFIGGAIHIISNIVSLIGIVLTTIFSIILIMRNINFKK